MKIVGVPLLDLSILATGEDHVGIVDKPQPSQRIIVSKDGLVTVAKVQSPNFHISVRAASGNYGRVARYVHADHRQLVAVQRKEKFQGVDKKYLDRRVEQADGDQSAVGTEADTRDPFFQLEAAHVDNAEHFVVAVVLAVDQLVVPELDRLVAATGHQAPVVRGSREAPHLTIVSRNLLRHVARAYIKHLYFSRLCPDKGVAIARREKGGQGIG